MFQSLMTSRKMPAFLLITLLLIFTTLITVASDLDTDQIREDLFARIAADQAVAPDLSNIQHASTPCMDGTAGGFECQNVDLVSHLPLADIGGGANGSDSWGWTDPEDGTEYGIVTRSNGTAFIDLSDPTNPIYLGNLPTNASSNIWRDAKVFNNHVFVVGDNVGNHGMQIFDLTNLRNVANPPATFTADAIYNSGPNGFAFGSAHNVVINEDSGYAYIVGGSRNTGCLGGLHMVDINDPLNPAFAGCFGSDGYTHDAQCVNYVGPDPDHQGKEICFNANEDTVTIVDVTDKTNPVQLGRTVYDSSQYSHQGWLSEDQTIFYQGDELDESRLGHATRTRVFDVTNLDDPVLIDIYDHSTNAIDHNMYIKDGLMYQANYQAGMRIIDVSDPSNLQEIAYFDTWDGDVPAFNSAWTAYPYFESGIVLVSDFEQGMFILKPKLAGVETGARASIKSGEPGEVVSHTVDILNVGILEDTYALSISGFSWDTELSDNNVTIAPNGQATISVIVTIPEEATLEEQLLASDSFVLTITSGIDEDVFVLFNGTTSYDNGNPDFYLYLPTLQSPAIEE